MSTQNTLESIIKKDLFFDKLFKKYNQEYNQLPNLECFYFQKNFNQKDYAIEYFVKKKQDCIFNFHYYNSCKIICTKESTFEEFLGFISFFLKSINVSKIKFKFLIKISNINAELYKSLLLLKPILIFKDKKIDLKKKIDDIFNDFKPNTKNEIRKSQKIDDVEIKIIHSGNYDSNKIIDMMKMHELVSYKKTRSLQTWLINEEMIKSDQGFIIEILYKKKTISYAFFFNNNHEVNYFSSVTLRENFKIFSINHLSILKAIQFAKKKNISFFNLGITEFLYTRENDFVNDKEKKIAFFKSRFGGEDGINIILDSASKI